VRAEGNSQQQQQQNRAAESSKLAGWLERRGLEQAAPHLASSKPALKEVGTYLSFAVLCNSINDVEMTRSLPSSLNRSFL